MTEIDPSDFTWINTALDRLKEVGKHPDRIEVDDVSGRVKFVYDVPAWGDDDE